MPRRRLFIWLVLAGAMIPLCGCRMIGAIGVLLTPPRMQDPEFKLTEGHLAVVIDHSRADQANPVFESELQSRFAELLKENKVTTQVIPYDDVVRLQQANPDFASWSLQRVGRALGADQILSIRLNDLRLAPGPNNPVITPHVELTLKLIGALAPAGQARLWPKQEAEPSGRIVTHDRPPKAAENLDVVDEEATKLARETAYFVARYFYKYDLEENPPHEP